MGRSVSLLSKSFCRICFVDFFMMASSLRVGTMMIE
jgi:hypothetical protein